MTKELQEAIDSFDKYTIQEKNEMFAKLLKQLDETPNDKKVVDKLWLLVAHCSSNIYKRKVKNVVNVHYDEVVMDATALSMSYLLMKDKRPYNFVTFCYFQVIKYLYSKRYIQYDKEESLDKVLEEATHEWV